MGGGDDRQIAVIPLLLAELVGIDLPRAPVDDGLLHPEGVDDRTAEISPLEPVDDARTDRAVGEEIDHLRTEGRGLFHRVVDPLAPPAHLDRAEPRPQLLLVLHRRRLEPLGGGGMKERIGGITGKDHEERLVGLERPDGPREFLEDNVKTTVPIAVGIVADETDALPLTGPAEKRRGRLPSRRAASLPAPRRLCVPRPPDLGEHRAGLEGRHRPPHIVDWIALCKQGFRRSWIEERERLDVRRRCLRQKLHRLVRLRRSVDRHQGCLFKRWLSGITDRERQANRLRLDNHIDRGHAEQRGEMNQRACKHRANSPLPNASRPGSVRHDAPDAAPSASTADHPRLRPGVFGDGDVLGLGVRAVLVVGAVLGGGAAVASVMVVGCRGRLASGLSPPRVPARGLTASHHGCRFRSKVRRSRRDAGHAIVAARSRRPLSLLRKPRELPRPLTDPPPQIGKLLEHLRDPPVVPVHCHTSHASSCPLTRHSHGLYARTFDCQTRAVRPRNAPHPVASLHGAPLTGRPGPLASLVFMRTVVSCLPSAPSSES